jgi:hypothetical protein
MSNWVLAWTHDQTMPLVFSKDVSQSKRPLTKPHTHEGYRAIHLHSKALGFEHVSQLVRFAISGQGDGNLRNVGLALVSRMYGINFTWMMFDVALCSSYPV